MKFLPPEYDTKKIFNYKPDMWIQEIKFIEETLLSLSSYNDKINILEWGSGNSSLYFSLFLRAMGICFEWNSMENFIPWHTKVCRLIAENNLEDNTFCHLVSPTNEENKQIQEEGDLEEYISFPYSLNKSFDLIIIDGRRRSDCLDASKSLLSDRGTVILHDAERVQYHDNLSLFSGDFYIQVTSPNSQGGVQKLWAGQKK